MENSPGLVPRACQILSLNLPSGPRNQEPGTRNHLVVILLTVLGPRRAPWAPGAASPGGPAGPNCYCRRWVGALASASKSVLILVSFFDRFGVALGPLLGAHLGHVGARFRPEWLPKPSSSRLMFEKVNFNGILRFPIDFDVFWLKMGTQNGPRSTQDRSKIVLDCFFSCSIFV